jgi:dTDP-4-amino-4,6-dideoxygalactose transaminase
MSTLAIDGGEKAVTLNTGEPWPRAGEEEIEAVVAALRKSREDWEYLCSARGGGPTAEMEQRWAEFMGARFCMATNSGGAALHIAVMAAGVQAGDEVIVSPYTWGQTVSCILQQCAIPVFADIDPETYTLDPADVERKITPYTKAIVVVHLYGHPADMDGIMAVARKHGLKVIEDCAQATGAIYKGRRVGTLGDFGCFSLGDGKQISAGEGGCLLTNDEDLYEEALMVGQHPMRQGWQVKSEERRKWMDSLIYTYRIHPLSAVMIMQQLPHLDAWNAQRRRNHELLTEGLKDIPGIKGVKVADGCEHVYHQYSPTFVPEEVEGVSREVYVKALAAEGVPISLGYVRTPIYLRPRFQQKNYFYGKGLPWSLSQRPIEYRPGDCPVAEHRCAHVELSSGGGPRWLGDQSALVRQILNAFEKVTGQRERLRELTKETSP